MVLMGYLRNVRYLDFPRRGMGFVKRFGMFLLAPIYGVIQLTLLTPLRFYALFTLHKGSWGTRQGGVEVSVAGDHESDVTEIFEEEDPYSDKKVTETLQLMRVEGVALRTRPRPAGGIPAQPQPIPGYDEEHHAGVPQQRVSWGSPCPGRSAAVAGRTPRSPGPVPAAVPRPGLRAGRHIRPRIRRGSRARDRARVTGRAAGRAVGATEERGGRGRPPLSCASGRRTGPQV